MAARGIFVTGTDTGVGKTVVAASLARLLRMNGIRVGVMKPVTSGCLENDGELASEDALLLCQAAGTPCSDDVAPYRLREPIAPAAAARIEGVQVDFSVIREAFDRLAADYEYLIVEGAGGLMVPLSGGLLVSDLALHLGLPLVVVSRPDLGTINHTLLTCYAAGQMGLSVSGVIINGMPDNPGPAEKSSPHQIGSLCGAPVLGIWPRIEADGEMELVDELAVWLDGQPETAIVMRELGL
ncbi:MAG: dethiobiotin synthase [Desulfuromonadales bacterium]